MSPTLKHCVIEFIAAGVVGVMGVLAIVVVGVLGIVVAGMVGVLVVGEAEMVGIEFIGVVGAMVEANFAASFLVISGSIS